MTGIGEWNSSSFLIVSLREVQVHSADVLGTQNQNKAAIMDLGISESQENTSSAQSITVP